jgi:hypothetical protein
MSRIVARLCGWGKGLGKWRDALTPVPLRVHWAELMAIYSTNRSAEEGGTGLLDLLRCKAVRAAPPPRTA